jgi:subfamily B ATP-binding cassette protein MsbA
VCVLFYNSWQLALIAVLVLGCAFIPVAKIQKRIKDVLGKSVVADSAIITEYNEAYAGNKTIISYNLAENEIKKFDYIFTNNYDQDSEDRMIELIQTIMNSENN